VKFIFIYMLVCLAALYILVYKEMYLCLAKVLMKTLGSVQSKDVKYQVFM